MYEKLAAITQIWQRAKCYFTSMNNASNLITVPYMKTITTFFSEISQHSKFILKNCHNQSNLAQSQILFYVHQQPMVPDHGTQYEGNPSSHHGGKHKDGQMDRTLSYIRGFHLAEWGIIKWCFQHPVLQQSQYDQILKAQRKQQLTWQTLGLPSW